MTNRKNRIKQGFRGILLSLGLGLFLIGALSVAGSAQTRNDSQYSRATIFYYSKNYQAVNRQRAEMRRGNATRVFYDNLRRKWAVEVRYAAYGTTTVRRNGNSSTQAGRLPNGATVLYFPTQDMADGIYRAHLRQGDWAKMWYDAKRREWVVAVKPNL